MFRRENAHNLDFITNYPCLALGQGLAYSLIQWISLYTNNCKRSEQPALYQTGKDLYEKATLRVLEVFGCQFESTTVSTTILG